MSKTSFLRVLELSESSGGVTRICQSFQRVCEEFCNDEKAFKEFEQNMSSTRYFEKFDRSKKEKSLREYFFLSV